MGWWRCHPDSIGLKTSNNNNKTTTISTKSLLGMNIILNLSLKYYMNKTSSMQ